MLDGHYKIRELRVILLTELLIIRSESFFKVRFDRNECFFVSSQDFKTDFLKIFIVQKL